MATQRRSLSDWSYKRAGTAMGLGLLLTLAVWRLVAAAAPPQSDPTGGSGRRVALVSTAAECLVVLGGEAETVSAAVRLAWKGQIEEAYLVLSAAGSEGEHSLYVNGRRVGSAPVHPAGAPCGAGTTVEIPLPAELLSNGENLIALTNDADPNDSWTAADLHIEIHGDLTGPPVAALEAPLPPPTPHEIGAMATVSGTVALTSTYELAHGQEISQVVWYQVPMSYTGSVSVPLLIALHGMGGTGEWSRDYFAPEADARGWLLAAPDMHGNYYVNHGRYALGWVGAQHDVIDTINYMAAQYEVDPARIYVAGGSMGGQATAMMSAKYPDLFPSVVPWKPFTDLTDWYTDVVDLGDPYGDLKHIRRETAGTSTGTTPAQAPFEYQRRSPIKMPQNSRLMPVKMWHKVDDAHVPIYHSRDFQAALNDHWNPPTPVTLIEVPAEEIDCPDDGMGNDLEHCYNPPPADVLDFLSSFVLDASPPISLSIRTDESKPYFWLNVSQTGTEHWSEVEVAYDPAGQTVSATISDSHPLTLAFNLGSVPLQGPGGIRRAGMGLPETTYLVKGGGNNLLQNYTYGYLTTTLTTTGQYSLTISTIILEVSADPSMVYGGDAVTSTILLWAGDRLDNAVPNGTTVTLTTTEGTFPNGSSTYTTSLSEGRATITLALGPGDTLAAVTAQIEHVTGTKTVDALWPAISVSIVPSENPIREGERITYTYWITNTGDSTLTDVTLVDDNGTPTNSSDDLTICEGFVLAKSDSQNCTRSAILLRNTTTTATAMGQDLLGSDVVGTDSVTVQTISFQVYLPLVKKQE